MTSYVAKLVERLTKEGIQNCFTNDYRRIHTDRHLAHPNAELVWEGYINGEPLAVTPDEAMELFNAGVLSGVALDYKGDLVMKFVLADARYFSGAIVCGIMSPTTQKELRPEIVAYAKKMGYVTEKMTPVEMFAGTKSLIVNEDGTYSIWYSWHDSTIHNFDRKFLERFTRNFFSNYSVEIREDGVLFADLSEEVVFHHTNIDDIRNYDIRLYYLSFDKQLLTWAIIRRASVFNWWCIDRVFEKNGDIVIPDDRKEDLDLDEGTTQKPMTSGVVEYSERENAYVYGTTLPYSETVRVIMQKTVEILREKFGDKVIATFYPFHEAIQCICVDEAVNADVERELLCLDYVFTLCQNEAYFHYRMQIFNIIFMLESDSTGRFRKEYFEYIEFLSGGAVSEESAKTPQKSAKTPPKKRRFNLRSFFGFK